MTNQKQGLGVLPVLLISTTISLLAIFGYHSYQKNKVISVINKRFEKMGLKIRVGLTGSIYVGNKVFEIDELGNFIDMTTQTPVSYSDFINEINTNQPELNPSYYLEKRRHDSTQNPRRYQLEQDSIKKAAVDTTAKG